MRVAEGLDPFNPNNWDFTHDQPCHIYLNDRCTVFALVDEIDYQFVIRYRWNALTWKGKTYARRAVGVNEGGKRLHTFSVYLHVEIMKRTGIIPATILHRIVDHRNGNSLDCTRKNLRYATHSMNSLNRNGSFPYDLSEG